MNHYYLWAWANPHPDRKIDHITIIPAGCKFLVAAITLGHADETPFFSQGRVPVKITLPDPEDAQAAFDLAVTVDRGVATYPHALPQASAEDFLGDNFPGFGEDQNPKNSPAYVEVAAIPSATVEVKRDEETLGSVSWGQLQACGTVETPRVALQIVDPGRNWVRVTVIDDATGRPVPCRVHFRSPEGIPMDITIMSIVTSAAGTAILGGMCG
jgi:hypothetical protein